MSRWAAPKAHGAAAHCAQASSMSRWAAPKATTQLRRRVATVRSTCDAVADNAAARSAKAFK